MNLTEATIHDRVARPASPRYADFFDGYAQDFDIEVGVGKDSHHPQQIVKDVDERAALRAPSDRENRTAPRRRVDEPCATAPPA